MKTKPRIYLPKSNLATQAGHQDLCWQHVPQGVSTLCHPCEQLKLWLKKLGHIFTAAFHVHLNTRHRPLSCHVFIAMGLFGLTRNLQAKKRCHITLFNEHWTGVVPLAKPCTIQHTHASDDSLLLTFVQKNSAGCIGHQLTFLPFLQK